MWRTSAAGRDDEQLHEWWLPRLCDSLGEALEASTDRGRGWSAVDSIRSSHNRRIAGGGYPDQRGVMARLDWWHVPF